MSLEHWEAYYRTGALATSPMGPQPGYTLEVRDTWVDFFSACADGARILDVGTGNGAVALIAAETAAALGRSVEIHGTDLAQIDPVKNVTGSPRLLATISFHAGIATEHLPFAPATIDAVSGQFALEYSQLEPALREVLRVLKPGGRARFIVHHSGSAMMRNALESLRHMNLIFGDTRILRRLRRYLEAERDSPAAAASLRRELAAAGERLRQEAMQSSNPHVLRVVLDAVQKLHDVRRKLSPAAMDRELDKVERDFRTSSRRLQDLVASAKDEEAARGMCLSAETLGFASTAPEPQLHAGSNIVGWRIDLSKA